MLLELLLLFVFAVPQAATTSATPAISVASRDHFNLPVDTSIDVNSSLAGDDESVFQANVAPIESPLSCGTGYPFVKKTPGLLGSIRRLGPKAASAYQL
jgi:hypothetical protein